MAFKYQTEEGAAGYVLFVNGRSIRDAIPACQDPATRVLLGALLNLIEKEKELPLTEAEAQAFSDRVGGETDIARRGRGW